MVIIMSRTWQLWSSGWHQFSKTFSLQHTLEGRHAISPHGSLDQFHKSFVSQHCLEELLLNGVHCSMKLMESLLIGKIATCVSDSMATCLWRILLALIWQHRNESSSSLVSNQIMHFAILYAKLMNEGAKDFSVGCMLLERPHLLLRFYCQVCFV